MSLASIFTVAYARLLPQSQHHSVQDRQALKVKCLVALGVGVGLLLLAVGLGSWDVGGHLQRN